MRYIFYFLTLGLLTNLFSKELYFNKYNSYHCTLQKFGNLKKYPYENFQVLCINHKEYLIFNYSQSSFGSVHKKLFKTGNKCSCYVKRK